MDGFLDLPGVVQVELNVVGLLLNVGVEVLRQCIMRRGHSWHLARRGNEEGIPVRRLWPRFSRLLPLEVVGPWFRH